MSINNTLQQFEASVRKVLKDFKTNREIIDQLQPAFQTLLNTKGLLPEHYKKPKSEKYSQFLLYKPQDEAFSIVAFIWGPGQTAPIHDHLVWGLVGIYEGKIEETRYRKVAHNNEEEFRLEIIETVVAKENDISFVYPPNTDIHSVRNPFDEPAITIHVYGTDIGKQKRNLYKNESFNKSTIVTAHENEEAIYH
ncbi:cysteine dioxygenase family protein [Domibacillus sp. DTU_2020_1001157_1_SI_ALB_TIR_016]|uniref:cysteine dioxygenase family protein n=1 Tax=Domibacillus sp. DTU_2020_1001157_1_SI_ALB_TIR_016 TaxID=3077789 RepID=UPI0028EBCF77|nr:cysteine dioxygenase family protein [Domibacillus sp. DTU_2020_1001157_1_SI_ALB_TIR_016]WNS78359.1 cysteine dioxygenase family protein [Domibacillus sp. DTU_2020_1001157_1_SI_ALB_TIR_016]